MSDLIVPVHLIDNCGSHKCAFDIGNLCSNFGKLGGIYSEEHIEVVFDLILRYAEDKYVQLVTERIMVGDNKALMILWDRCLTEYVRKQSLFLEIMGDWMVRNET